MKYFLFISLLLLSSCGIFRGADYHIRKAKKHLLIAQSMGANISVDSIKKNIPVNFKVPKLETDTNFNSIDSSKFNLLIKRYDSLSHLLNKPCPEFKPGAHTTSLVGYIDTTPPNQDSQNKIKEELLKTRKLLQKNFYKDSVYFFNPDSLTKITLTLKSGKINLDYKKKEVVYKDTLNVALGINNKISTGHSTWDMVILFWVALLIGFLVGVIYKTRQWKEASS